MAGDEKNAMKCGHFLGPEFRLSWDGGLLISLITYLNTSTS
jgi:hypothetical protein